MWSDVWCSDVVSSNQLCRWCVDGVIYWWELVPASIPHRWSMAAAGAEWLRALLWDQCSWLACLIIRCRNNTKENWLNLMMHYACLYIVPRSFLLGLIKQLWPPCVTSVMEGLNILLKFYCNGLWIYELTGISLQVQKSLVNWSVQLVWTISQSLLNNAVPRQRGSVSFTLKLYHKEKLHKNTGILSLSSDWNKWYGCTQYTALSTHHRHTGLKLSTSLHQASLCTD
jgi:hypothetical protein